MNIHQSAEQRQKETKDDKEFEGVLMMEEKETKERRQGETFDKI